MTLGLFFFFGGGGEGRAEISFLSVTCGGKGEYHMHCALFSTGKCNVADAVSRLSIFLWKQRNYQLTIFTSTDVKGSNSAGVKTPVNFCQ